jgi:hypothetical protein
MRYGYRRLYCTGMSADIRWLAYFWPAIYALWLRRLLLSSDEITMPETGRSSLLSSYALSLVFMNAKSSFWSHFKVSIVTSENVTGRIFLTGDFHPQSEIFMISFEAKLFLKFRTWLLGLCDVHMTSRELLIQNTGLGFQNRGKISIIATHMSH